MNCEDTPDNVCGWTNFLPVAQSWFPHDKAVAMGERWLSRDNPDGFYSDIPLSSMAQRDWDKVLCPGGTMESYSCGNGYWSEFAVTPDTNYFLQTALWRHDVTQIALEATLGHLRKNHYMDDDGMTPCAPESREADFSLWGDQYSNFNAGKILSLVEGVGGLSYSVVGGEGSVMTHQDSLPLEWDHMEWRLPISSSEEEDVVHWVLLREDRYCTDDPRVYLKVITAESNPLEVLHLNPWTEGATLLEYSTNTVASLSNNSNSSTVESTLTAQQLSPHRLGFTLRGDAAKAKVTISLRLRHAASDDVVVKCSSMASAATRRYLRRQTQEWKTLE